MKELSLFILDIAQNSLSANSKNLEITLEESNNQLTITIKDDGSGMDRDTLNRVENPFFTTRTTRKVGLGIPFFKQAAEQTGGFLSIQSLSETDNPSNHGTTVTALFYKNSIDYTPMGDIVSTVCALVQGLGITNFIYTHTFEKGRVELDTNILRKTLKDIPLDNPEVINWIREYLEEQYADYEK
ncbi:MAG: sensor histidine kinase [Clostridiales bacterium]|jgi:hypothetical protein|nr:sensor histidine kinase [Clostridiales bacterium]